MSQKEYKKIYKEIEVIGRGNFGSATLIERFDNKKQYIAKKIILSSLNDKQQDSALQEAQLLKDLNHKNIVSYVESFKEDDLLIIVMEYCEHGDLAFHIKRKKQKKEHFPEMLIVNWFFELALSLKYIHEKKILHRDIKTSNIFITKDGTIKIGDFGISKVLENTTSVAKTVVGTPYYMSPEVCESKPYTYKSDVWALGCVLYELCALEHAFESNNLLGLIFKIVKQNIQDIPDIYSKELNELIHKLLNKNEAERPVIHEILNDMCAQKLFKQYLEVRPDKSQVKQDSLQNTKKMINGNHQQSIQNGNEKQAGNVINCNKENNAINQLIINNQNDKFSSTKNNGFVETSSPMNTVDSQVYQLNGYDQPLHNCENGQQGQKEENNQIQLNQIKNKPKQNKRQIILADVIKEHNDGTHDEYYYQDDDQFSLKSKKEKFDEKTIIKHNNFLRQQSPQNLQKVQSQQSLQSKFKKEDISNQQKQIDMHSSVQNNFSSSNQSHQYQRDKAYSQPQNGAKNTPNNQNHNNMNGKQLSSVYQQNHQIEQLQQQQYQQQKPTPKQIAELKKLENSRLKQEQLSEYTKNQTKNSLNSREKHIQNIYGDKFIANQSSLKQPEENSKQKQQIVLEPLNQAKGLLKNNFINDRNNSPSSIYKPFNQQLVDTQFVQEVPVPYRNGLGKNSPIHFSNLIRNEEKTNPNVYSEMEYPLEASDKFSASTTSNQRRKNQNVKNDFMQTLQEDEQNKQYYNQIHRHVPNLKSTFSQAVHSMNNEGKKNMILKSYTLQDELAESQMIDHQQFVNKIIKAQLPNKNSQNQDINPIQPQKQGGVNYSNTQFESDIDIQSQDKYSYTQFQDIPMMNKIDNEVQKDSPLKSFDSFFSKEDLNDQMSENKVPIIQPKQVPYKIKSKPNQSSFVPKKNSSKKQKKGSDNEYDEEFEEYFSDEEIKKQAKQGQNNSQKSQNNSRNNSKDKVPNIQLKKQPPQNSQGLESIQEHDFEQTQFTPLATMARQQSGNSSQGKKLSTGTTPKQKIESNNIDSNTKFSKRISHQNSVNSTDDQPPSRLSNQSRNSPKNIIDASVYKNNSNAQVLQNNSKLVSLRVKCKQNLGEHFEKVYEIIQKSIDQNLQNYKMKQLLVDIVGKQKINECFEVEQLIYIEEELKKK